MSAGGSHCFLLFGEYGLERVIGIELVGEPGAPGDDG
jgi:hypothetical protein